MHRIAFKMKINKGCADEYRKRHDAIWNDLARLLKETGIADYSIFLDEETNDLFAYLTINDPSKLEELRLTAVMKKWWHYMKDIMETNDDDSPVTVPLKEVFYLR